MTLLPETAPIRVGGLVVCGGKSSRMGRAKAWLELGPETFLQRVVRVLGEVVSPIVVVAAQGQELPPLPDGITVVRDEFDGKGPLAGLATGMAALQGRCEAVYASSTDVPLLRAEFVRALISKLGEADFVLPREGKFHHPLAACYRVALEPIVRRLVVQGRLRPVFLLDEARGIEVDVEDLRVADPDLDSLRNCNTPDEYEQLLGHWDAKGRP
jgi:molybdenum cofactor guanylyltransferase